MGKEKLRENYMEGCLVERKKIEKMTGHIFSLGLSKFCVNDDKIGEGEGLTWEVTHLALSSFLPIKAFPYPPLFFFFKRIEQ